MNTHLPPLPLFVARTRAGSLQYGSRERCCQQQSARSSVGANLNLSGVDLSLDLGGVLTVDGAADGDACSEDLLDGTGKGSRVGLCAHLLGDFNNVIELYLSVVDGVLYLLSISWGFLKGLEHEGCGGGEDGNEASSVLNHNFDVNLDSFPCGGGLLDIFTDLLGGETDGAALGGEGSGSSNLSADNLHPKELLFSGICDDFGWHFVFIPIY